MPSKKQHAVTIAYVFLGGDMQLNLRLSDGGKKDLIEYLKGI